MQPSPRWVSTKNHRSFHEKFWGQPGQNQISDAEQGDKILRIQDSGCLNVCVALMKTNGQIYLRQEMMDTVERLRQTASSGVPGVVLTGPLGCGVWRSPFCFFNFSNWLLE